MTYQYAPMFPLAKDTTPYRKISSEGVKVEKLGDREVLTVSREAMRLLAEQAMIDINHLLRPGHLAQLAKILDDPEATRRFVVLTGGEPMLQIDDALVDALHAAGFEIAIESNGTLPTHPGIDWVCISPKAGSVVVQRSGDELKLVWPQAGSDWQAMEAWDFAHFLVQPMDDARGVANVADAVDFAMTRPKWRLSLQTHKALGLR